METINSHLRKGNPYIINNAKYPKESNNKDEYKKSGNYPIFGCCTRIDIKTQGLDCLLKGFAKFLIQYEGKGKLWIVGEGEELNKLKKLADELEISKHVKFWGERFGDEKINIISNMDVFYYLSRQKELNRGVMVAAGLSTPCVISQENYMSEYFSNYRAGIGLPSTNEDTVAISMQNMLIYYFNSEIKRLKKNALEMFKREFDGSVVSTKFRTS